MTKIFGNPLNDGPKFNLALKFIFYCMT